MSLTSLFCMMIALSTFAATDPCDHPVDMRLPGGAMESIPVLNQFSTDLCYSYSAAQMVNAYNRSHGDKDLPLASAYTSAMENGYQSWGYREFKNPLGSSGGTLCKIVKSIQKYGACSEATVNSMSPNQLGVPHDLHFLINNLFQFHRDYQNLKNKAAELERDQNAGGSYDWFLELRKNQEAQKATLEQATKFIIQWQSKLQDLPPNYAAVKKAFDRDWNSLRFAYAKVMKACLKTENRVTPDVPDCHTDLIFKGSKGIKRIHELLDRQDVQPVGISYCSSILFNRNYSGGLWQNIKESLSKNRKCISHISLVIGRRNITRPDGSKVCQFLVRDSKGAVCKPYDWACEAGNVWIDQKALERVIYGVEWLE